MKKKGLLILAFGALALAALGLFVGKLLFSGPTLRPNPYGPGDFALRDGRMVCLKGEARAAIDVSVHQGEIDWQAVKESGVEAVMIRAGYRGYQTGLLHPDDRAEENYRGAKAAGLKVGAYFFSQAVTVEEAKEEAEFFLNLIRDWELDLWAAYDWETMGENARTYGMEKKTLTACTRAFLDTVALEELRPMVYFNVYQGDALLELEELAGYDFWLAMYREEMDYPYRLAMWQYSSQGEVPGIPGRVDLNLLFP